MNVYDFQKEKAKRLRSQSQLDAEIKQRMLLIRKSNESYEDKYIDPVIFETKPKRMDPLFMWSTEIYWTLDPYYSQQPRWTHVVKVGKNLVNDLIRISEDQIEKYKMLYSLIDQGASKGYKLHIDREIQKLNHYINNFLKFKALFSIN